MTTFRLACLAGAACAALLAFACPARAAVTVQISPATLTVAPDTDFDLKIRVTETGSAFNGFTAYVVYDPAMLTPVPLSPLRTQIDSLFTDACAVGSHFHKFKYGGGVDSISVSMLCADVSVTGPGPIYHLRFHAGPVVGRTGLSFGPGLKFANGGVLASPIHATGAIVGIGMPVLDVPPMEGESGAPRMTVTPQPASAACRLAFTQPLAFHGVLRVHDAMGRIVREEGIAAGSSSWVWDGRSATGESAPPGVYLAELRCGAIRRFARIVRVR